MARERLWLVDSIERQLAAGQENIAAAAVQALAELEAATPNIQELYAKVRPYALKGIKAATGQIFRAQHIRVETLKDNRAIVLVSNRARYAIEDSSSGTSLHKRLTKMTYAELKGVMKIMAYRIEDLESKLDVLETFWAYTRAYPECRTIEEAIIKDGGSLDVITLPQQRVA